MVTPGSPRKQSVPLGKTQPGNFAVHSREKKKPWVTPRWEHSSITFEKPKIRENNIDRMNPRCGHKADIKQKALSISLLRKYISYSTFSNHFQILYLYKVHIYRIPFFPNRILSKINSRPNHTYIDFDYIKSLSKLSTFQINRFQINFILIQSILYKFDHSQIKCLII